MDGRMKHVGTSRRRKMERKIGQMVNGGQGVYIRYIDWKMNDRLDCVSEWLSE
jgi:hypothetical protein